MAAFVSFDCAYCGKAAQRLTGSVNRSRRNGAPLYCGRECAGLARRQWKTDREKREEKRLYDAKYRDVNAAVLKEKKKKRHLNTYDPQSAAEYRKARMHIHIAYCRRPEYRARKKEYDQLYRAKKMYGQFSEAYISLLKLTSEINSRIDRSEIYQQNGIAAKSTKRRRDYEKLNRC